MNYSSKALYDLYLRFFQDFLLRCLTELEFCEGHAFQINVPNIIPVIIDVL